MSCICDKCTFLWKSNTKKFCCKPVHLPHGDSCKYSQHKKGCPCFTPGDNIKKFESKVNKGWSRGWSKK